MAYGGGGRNSGPCLQYILLWYITKFIMAYVRTVTYILTHTVYKMVWGTKYRECYSILEEVL